ncbi:MAG: glycosyltransferase family 1 protein [Patescibacteria group bacterium]
MLIGIDANEANLTPNLVGINEYAYNLLWAIYNLKSNHKFVTYLKTPPQKSLPPERWDWKYRVIPFPKFWTQTRLPWDLYTHQPRPDVFFSMTHYAPRFSPIPTVVAIMDLGFLQTPEQFTSKDFNQLKSWTAYSVKNAAKIIAISQYTKQDIIKNYHRDPQDIVVTLLGYNTKLFKPSHKPRKPYILFLSSLKPNKNVEGLIRAFYNLTPRTYNLVIAGKKAWLYDQIFALVKQLGLEDEVKFTGFVDEATKVALMQRASAYVLPSFHEGFGIPVLEAMACGTPVVISQVASLPEVGGDAAIYVDPHDPKSIAQGIIQAMGPERSQRIKKGLERVKLFSWAKTAQLTLTCLETATTNH